MAEQRQPKDASRIAPRTQSSPPVTIREEIQPCPRCGHAMPALKGGSASICPNCGFKDSCCY